MCNRCNALVPATKFCTLPYPPTALQLCQGWFVTCSLAVSDQDYLEVQVLTMYLQVQVLQEVLTTSKYKYFSSVVPRSASPCARSVVTFFVGGKDRRQISILSPWLEGGQGKERTGGGHGQRKGKGGRGHRKDTRRTKTKKGGQKRTGAGGRRMHNHKKTQITTAVSQCIE